MEAYMERIKDWADRHGESMENQYPKVPKNNRNDFFKLSMAFDLFHPLKKQFHQCPKLCYCTAKLNVLLVV
jgi:hypothetical protein